MNSKLHLAGLLYLGLTHFSLAQALFQGLTQPIDARGWGIGSATSGLIATPTGFVSNPALLTHIAPQWQCSYTSYALNIYSTGMAIILPDKWLNGNIGLTIGHLDYGNFDERNEVGTLLGEYQVQDQYFRLGYAHALGQHLSGGGLIGYVHSNLAGYRTQALIGAIGGHYYDAQSTFSLALAWNNFTIFSASYLNKRESLPGTITAAVAKKLEHLPMIFTLEGSYFQQRYYLLKIGGEFNWGERFFLRWGTSTRRFQIGSQATLVNFTSGSSLGFGLKFKNWRLDTSMLSLGHAGQVASFSIGQNFN
jgi:hypothetical protein